MARRKKDAEEGGQPAWLVTFSDLMTLLLTFFVLLLSMAVIDERAKRVVLGSVTRAFGAGERIFNPMASSTANTATEPGVMSGSPDDLAPLRDMVYDDTNKDLNFQENKYVQIFSINDRVLFRPGEARLSDRGVQLLDSILPYLQHIEYPLLVAGHTAVRRDEEGAATYRVEENRSGADSTWAVSFHRALAVYKHLALRGVSTDRLSLEAFGQYHPRSTNNTAAGRQKNRRVDLVLDKRNLEWIKKVEALREAPAPAKPETYFKGFRFDLSIPGKTPDKGEQR